MNEITKDSFDDRLYPYDILKTYTEKLASNHKEKQKELENSGNHFAAMMFESCHYQAKMFLSDLDKLPSITMKEMVTHVAKEFNEPTAEWVMVEDDFDDGFEARPRPHCSKCGRGVYKHDAGSFCTFCGSQMKNPMV